jgi:hypothetical protein
MSESLISSIEFLKTNTSFLFIFRKNNLQCLKKQTDPKQTTLFYLLIFYKELLFSFNFGINFLSQKNQNKKKKMGKVVK